MTPTKAPIPTRDGTAPGHPAAPLGPVERAEQLATDWAPTVARILLGLVLSWFGYHELVQPSLWTGYVPLVSGSEFLVLLVLAHGWLLLMLAVAMFAGIAVRVVAALSAFLMIEIVTSMTITNGLSDLVLRDVGVLGLAVCLTAATRQRLVLTG